MNYLLHVLNGRKEPCPPPTGLLAIRGVETKKRHSGLFRGRSLIRPGAEFTAVASTKEPEPNHDVRCLCRSVWAHKGTRGEAGRGGAGLGEVSTARKSQRNDESWIVQRCPMSSRDVSDLS